MSVSVCVFLISEHTGAQDAVEQVNTFNRLKHLLLSMPGLTHGLLLDSPLKHPLGLLAVLKLAGSNRHLRRSTQIDDGLSPGRCPPSARNNQQMGVRAEDSCLLPPPTPLPQ